jgi:rhamnosyltransferase subunit B
MKNPLNVIVIGLGSAGDVNPLIGLALALQRRGHRVLFVAFSIFKPLAESAGLEFAGVLDDEYFHESLRDPDLWHPIRALSVVVRLMMLPGIRPVYEIIEKRMGAGPTVVAASSMAFGARIAQEKLGVSLATVHLQPSLLRSVIDPAHFSPDILASLPQSFRKPYLHLVDRLLVDPLLAKGTNGFRAKLGLPPVKRFLNSWIHSPQRILGFFPDWFAQPQPDWPPRVALTGFPLWDQGDVGAPNPELSAFLAAGPPPLIFTAGTAMAHSASFFRVSAELCRTTGRRGLFLTRFPDQLPASLPPGVAHFDYVPFSRVLPYAAALVHHGGIGTTAQALSAGVPQLVVPLAFDQPDNGWRVCRLGVGAVLPPKSYTPGNARVRLEKLLTAGARECCQAYARRFADVHPLETASRLIEDLAG